MIQKRRLDTIMGILKEEGMADVKTLSQRLEVTEKTVRLDLKELENQNLLERVHGGAVLKTQELSLGYKDSSRRTSHLEQKQVIARRALTLIEENDVILLDDGSTTQEVAKLLGDFRVTVLTNDLLIVNELMYKPNITLYIIGGLVRRDSDSYIVTGEDAIQFLKKYRVSILFLGTSTVDVKEGLMIFNYGDNFTKRAFIDAADRVVCLADSSKFDRTAFTKVARLNEVDTFITDSGLSQEVIRRYEGLGREIIVA
ncbi:MAG: DeoR/GlpR transcriptional regulator [Clostridium sp.]|nr:DeoR/GlpR transcriptional regulator [Clostridium sp.]